MSALKAVTVFLLLGTAMTCSAREWRPLWTSYAAAFMDDQVRVIDRDAGDRTTSEGQAYAMFFALVANDRARFDGLLRWTELNLAGGDLTARLPAWLWGRGADNRWGVVDTNSAADADVWMAYTLIEAGEAWKEARYTRLGRSLARRIAAEEVVSVPGIGPVLLSGTRGFKKGDSYRFNVSYMPLQLFAGLGRLEPDGPWQEMASQVPALVRASAPHGFATDWLDFTPEGGFKPSPVGSYDAIRVYLWAGMLDPSMPGRDVVLHALSGMTRHLRNSAVPPAKVQQNGTIDDPEGPVGFSAALVLYLSAVGESALADKQRSRVRSERNGETNLYGSPSRYYDQNLVLFALGAQERQFWFDARGKLNVPWAVN